MNHIIFPDSNFRIAEVTSETGIIRSADDIPAYVQNQLFPLFDSYNSSGVPLDAVLVRRGVFHRDTILFDHSFSSVSFNPDAELPHRHSRVCLYSDQNTTVGTMLYPPQSVAQHFLGKDFDGSESMLSQLDAVIATTREQLAFLRDSDKLGRIHAIHSAIPPDAFRIDYRQYDIAIINDGVWHAREMLEQNGNRSTGADLWFDHYFYNSPTAEFRP